MANHTEQLSPAREWLNSQSGWYKHDPIPEDYKHSDGSAQMAVMTRKSFCEALDAYSAPLRQALHTGVTDKQVFFYERDFYVLSNFSAFRLYWKGLQFYNSEFAYHWEKFPHEPDIQAAIRNAMSAHEAFKIAERHKASVREDWMEVRVPLMKELIRAKAEQHEYVRRKLMATGDLELVENSWRDSFWGSGPNGDGQNMLGKLWMEVRSELLLGHSVAQSQDGK
jgi:ribA/ribD-fused uncharacterized protein